MRGLDVGIVVMKQLVDQEKWIKVLREIGKQCPDVPQFPVTSTSDYRSFTLQDLCVLKITEKFNFRGEHMYSGWLCDPSADHRRPQSKSDHRKHAPRRTYFERLISTCSYPPIAYFFDIGGFLCFPVFCRHFKSQIVRVTGHRAFVLEILEKCFSILQNQFPHSVSFFQEAPSKDYNHCNVKCHQPNDFMS